jgi:hypothetical protein
VSGVRGPFNRPTSPSGRPLTSIPPSHASSTYGRGPGGTRQVLWADDSNDNSHALRAGNLSC